MGGSNSTRSRSSLHFKVLFGALALVGVVFLFLVDNQESGRGKMAPTSTTTHSVGNFKHADVMGREKLVDHPELDFNYISKRKVPNGPDPIHNRRTGNSGRPPGRNQRANAQQAPGTLN
ncbi:CLAVATA3/ESR (CLE)-related protein 25 [Alnus glutinosa]|uniref:CLAVATA3/ESR (CLE)-related protein 25 n=1 Tax=Alnus glutinosa TaxID=3517 RepID=UPI002D7883D3|nr:CLAVATA3/ESR (CLE)-related protein 25 [Alnus glutinosa]